MQTNHPFAALLAALAPKTFDVVLHLGIPSSFAFRVQAPTAEAFHDFLRDARDSGATWVKVNAVHEETGSPYVTGFDPRIVIGMDLTDIEADDADEDETGSCGPDCTCYPAAEEPVNDAAGLPETEAAPAPQGEPADVHEALARLFREAREKQDAQQGAEAARPPMPMMMPGLLGLAILASALKPPAR